MLGVFTPGVVIIDQSVEQLDIAKAIEFIGTAETLKNVTVIVLSDRATHEQGRLLISGARCVIGKPFDRNDLLEKVSRFIVNDTSCV